MFTKILIANRGEIACRVIKTARRMGIATVAVYSDADANARHVRLADEAVRIGPAAARESYLRADKILEVARATGAQAVHPGYGFLSENDAFADACAEAGIVFIGPPASAIRAMGSKSAAKALMEKAGVPLTPGYHGDQQEPAFLAEQAARIGYPVLIKASAGGGGKGMRRVDRAEDFESALASCQREAINAFGDQHVLVEKYVLRPRHIEIQVFGDTQGDCVYLFERDCSVQRRHQKVLEEAPAPGMTPERRAAMGQAAVEAAKAVGYVGAGTVEFIANQDGSFYFMEMNTRLQVEHPVTEMITGLDLVEWQLRVASGEPLPLRQEQLTLDGHALEARIYAEDPDRGFLPSTGRLVHLVPPAESDHVRVDTGVEQGDEISPHYDPMIAKLIVWDRDRPRALARMRAALAELLRERQRASGRQSPWDGLDGWRLNGSATRKLTLRLNDTTQEVGAEVAAGGGYQLSVDGKPAAARGTLGADGELQAQIGGRRVHATVLAAGERRHVFFEGRCWPLALVNTLHTGGGGDDVAGGLRAPMPGKVIALSVAPGTTVEKGAALLVIEAMKMEHTISAPRKGVVKAYRCAPGDQVSDGTDLLDFEEAE